MREFPDEEKCLQILKKHEVPQNIVDHSLKVKEVAINIAESLSKAGEDIDQNLVLSSALLHDIAKYKCLDKDKHHVGEGARILKEEGFEKIAKIVSKHGLTAVFEKKFQSWEEKVIYYADKRVKEDKVVSLEERIEDLKERYLNFREEIKKAEPLIKNLEEDFIGSSGAEDSKDLVS